MKHESDEPPNAGEEFSQHLLQSRHRLYGFIYSLVHDHSVVDDIFQEVARVLWRKFDRFDPETDFAAWAMSVARLSILEWRRKQKKVPLPLADETLMLLADDAVAISFENDERTEALHSCLPSLTEKQRALLRRRYQQKESVTNIAESSHITPRAIYKTLNHIHQQLHSCIRQKLSTPSKP